VLVVDAAVDRKFDHVPGQEPHLTRIEVTLVTEDGQRVRHLSVYTLVRAGKYRKTCAAAAGCGPTSSSWSYGWGYGTESRRREAIAVTDDPSDEVWFTRFEETQAVRECDAVDIESEARLIELVPTRQRTVFDPWALAWIGDTPLVRSWI
jgi:hypothetical protein